MTKTYGPADTNDAAEVVSSVRPSHATDAGAGRGTTSASVTIDRIEDADTTWLDSHRAETYQVPGPDGELVTVEHNIDTGETRVIGREA